MNPVDLIKNHIARYKTEEQRLDISIQDTLKRDSSNNADYERNERIVVIAKLAALYTLLLELPDRPVIVTLCGSTRFAEAFHAANLRETLAGKIVLSIGVNTKSDADLLLAGELTQKGKERLDVLHLKKIDESDEIFVLNVGGYIGSSTAKEIQHAWEHGKVIRYLEPVTPTSHAGKEGI